MHSVGKVEDVFLCQRLLSSLGNSQLFPYSLLRAVVRWCQGREMIVKNCVKVLVQRKCYSLTYQRKFRTLPRYVFRNISTKPTFDVKKFVDLCYTEDYEKDMKILMAPYNYIHQSAYTNTCTKFIDALNYWLKIPEDQVQFIKELNDMCSISLLMIDDVIDNSTTRRGFPTAHKIYGENRVILNALSLNTIMIKKIYASNYAQITEGALEKAVDFILAYFSSIADQLYMEENVKCLTREEYYKKAIGQVGSFFLFTYQLMQAYSNCQTDFTRLIALYSIYIQVQNDYINLDKQQYNNYKEFGEDIGSGTYSFPIVLAAETKTEDVDIILDILKRKSKETEVQLYCVNLLEKLGAIKGSKDMEALFYQEIVNEVERHGGNPQFIKIMDNWQKWKSCEMYTKHPLYDSTKVNQE